MAEQYFIKHKKCAMCGSDFIATNNRQIYCKEKDKDKKDTCSYKNNRKLSKIWQQNHPEARWDNSFPLKRGRSKNKKTLIAFYRHKIHLLEKEIKKVIDS